MKRRVLKKQMRRIINSELPVMFKLSAMHEMINVSSKSGIFQFKGYTFNKFNGILMFTRFSTSLHKGYVTVSEHDCIEEIGFSSWHKALNWICKQAKVDSSVYVIDSGHYRYRVYP